MENDNWIHSIKLQEEEANVFAIALLVPRKALRKELDNTQINIADGDAALTALANKFEVSVTTIMYALHLYDFI